MRCACDKEFPPEAFYWTPEGKLRSRVCKACRREASRLWYGRRRAEGHPFYKLRRDNERAWRKANPTHYLLTKAKHSASRRQLVFRITAADLEPLPNLCPVLGIELHYEFLALPDGSTNPATPTIDRFNNDLGYIPGNVSVMSNRANMLKSTATLEEVEALAVWMWRMSRVLGLVPPPGVEPG